LFQAIETVDPKKEINMIEEKEVHSSEMLQNRAATDLFDRAELLDNFDGDEELVQSLSDDAVTEIPKEVEKLQAAYGEGNCKAIHLQAHTIKGMSANLCTPALRDIAAKIETAAKEGDMDSVRLLLPELEQTAYQTVAVIRG
jgi:HPt (histidine-containing phosphotransfer) domain-containing protein